MNAQRPLPHVLALLVALALLVVPIGAQPGAPAGALGGTDWRMHLVGERFDVYHVYQFAPDGTFRGFNADGQEVTAGTWQQRGQSVTLRSQRPAPWTATLTLSGRALSGRATRDDGGASWSLRGEQVEHVDG